MGSLPNYSFSGRAKGTGVSFSKRMIFKFKIVVLRPYLFFFGYLPSAVGGEVANTNQPTSQLVCSFDGAQRLGSPSGVYRLISRACRLRMPELELLQPGSKQP